MLIVLKKTVDKLIKHNPDLKQCEDIEGKMAVCLLLSHLIPADGKVLDCETDRLAKLISRRFGVSQGVVREFMDLTELNRNRLATVDVMVDEIKSYYSEKKLISFVRDLWDIALSDNELHTLEEAMIYNVADRLGLSRRDVIGQQVRVCR